jgi:hypothetical protein
MSASFAADKGRQTRTERSAAGRTVLARGKLMQGKCACGHPTGSAAECEECRKKELQRKDAGASASAIAPPIVHEVLASAGQPLESSARDGMERNFAYDFGRVSVHPAGQPATGGQLRVAPPNGPAEQQADRVAGQTQDAGSSPSPASARSPHRDFGGVRVHTDALADESAKAVNAVAYTVGNHIVFRAQQYQPGTLEGRRLLAHEVAHVVQQEGDSGAGRGIMQRKVAVDPNKFTGPNKAKDLADFEKMIVDELKAVTGMNLSFSSDVLSASGPPTGGSATAQQMLNLALSDQATVWFDPSPALGAKSNPGRGIEIGMAKAAEQLKSLRTGIVIIHELAHNYAPQVKPAGYDSKIRQLQQDAQAGKQLKNEEWELVQNYSSNVKADENIPVGVENKVQQEMGLIQRIHYGIQIEFPPKAGKTGAAAWTTYAVFKTADQPPLFLYLNDDNYDIYSSTVDYFDETVKAGKPVVPQPGAMVKIVKGTPAYQAVQKHLM